MRVNLLNRLGEGKTRLEGLIGPLEREELSAQSEIALADDIIHYTLRIISLIFISPFSLISLLIRLS